MKKLLIASAALVVMSAPVLAADMPARPAPVVPPFAWNGCYIGLNVGYGWANFEKTNVTGVDALTGVPLGPPIQSPFADFSFDGDHFNGGTQVGCNWQAGIVVWGVEADIQVTSIEARHYFDNAFFNVPSPNITDTEVHSDLRWFGTVRGRVGWTVWPETMVYLTGGFAYAGIDSSLGFHSPNPLLPSGNIGFDSNIHWGYTVGVGAEAKVARNFSVKIEYLYIDLLSQDYEFADLRGLNPPLRRNFAWEQEVDLHVIRIGLNYQWDWGYPLAPWGIGKGKGVPAPAPVVRK